MNKKIIDIIVFTLFFGVLMVVFTYAAYRYAIRSIEQLERSWSTWDPLLWPVKITIPACGTLMLLQGISELIKMFFSLFGKGEMVGVSEDDPNRIAQEIQAITGIETVIAEKHFDTGDGPRKDASENVSTDENDAGGAKS